MGSVIDGEDVVQDTMAKAVTALHTLRDAPSLRSWLFRVAHNRALDLLRSRSLQTAEPIEAASDIADEAASNPVEILIRREAVTMALSRFSQLPVTQRSVIILKDVLDEPLSDIAELLDLSMDAVKAHLARGRAGIHRLNALPEKRPAARRFSDATIRYVTLFNQRDWEGLRALLAEDVRLHQSARPPRVGAGDVGMFFGIYAQLDGLRLVPAWLEDREVIAVFEKQSDRMPSYLMWLDWQEEKISFIRDYRYVRYVVAGAEFEYAPGSDCGMSSD